jgi:hypothetical protein
MGNTAQERACRRTEGAQAVIDARRRDGPCTVFEQRRSDAEHSRRAVLPRVRGELEVHVYKQTLYRRTERPRINERHVRKGTHCVAEVHGERVCGTALCAYGEATRVAHVH